MPVRPELLCFGHDPVLNRTRRLILQRYFEVRSASHLTEALTLLSTQRFGVVLLCYSLSTEECRAVIDLVQTASAQTRILALHHGGERLALEPPHEELFYEGPAELLSRLAAMAGIPLAESPALSDVRRIRGEASTPE